MRTMLAFAILTSIAHADDFRFVGRYDCKTATWRQGESLPSRGRLALDVRRAASGIYKLEDVTGHVEGGYTPAELGDRDGYYTVFRADGLLSNPAYRARTYTGWTQFKDFNGSHDTWGTLVIDLRTPTAPTTRAAYVFQSGDHMGGTIDFNCDKTF